MQGEPLYEVWVLPLGATKAVLRDLAAIKRALGIIIEGEHEIMTDIHDEIAAAIGPVVDAVSAVSADVARELADFANQVAPKLTDEEKAQFASLAQKLTDLDASVNAVDPAPAPPADGADAGEAPATA